MVRTHCTRCFVAPLVFSVPFPYSTDFKHSLHYLFSDIDSLARTRPCTVRILLSRIFTAQIH
jgi:hypothetical protein